jgi:predicted 2-oxoglutarate/Fe(II)-dependent dioxygenase YbiX
MPPNNSSYQLGVGKVETISENDIQSLCSLMQEPDNLQVSGRVNRGKNSLLNKSIRDVQVWVLHEKFTWVDEWIIRWGTMANRDFGLQVTGLIERPQILKYNKGSTGYNWHYDIGDGDASNRKISLSVILDDKCEGGELCFFTDGEYTLSPVAGEVIAFPSFFSHRVKPVTDGCRLALVAWLSGEPLR